jgi:hypothetical protein
MICAFALALAAQAETPAGETPAEESVCDGLADGAAWGLCNAYCEAMDCDGASQASDQACQHVLENFMAQDAGPIPCPPCPCFDETDLNDLVEACAEPGGLLFCNADPTSRMLFCRPAEPNEVFLAFSVPENCGAFDSRDLDPNISLDNLTPDEELACFALLEAKQGEGVCDFGP